MNSIVTVEALDELARLALEKNPRKDKIISQIEETTALGMEGKILSLDKTCYFILLLK